MKKYVIIAFHIFIIIFGTYFIWKYNSHENTYYQNLKASRDTINILRMENGNLLQERDAYILKESELSSILNYNSNEIRELKEKLGSIESITKIESVVELDTVYVPIDTTFNFKIEEPWFNMKGKVETDKLVLHGISFPLTLTTGFTTDNKVFVETDNPYTTIKDFNGSKVKSFDIKHEVVVGVGLQYGLLNRNLDFGPSISYGLVIEF
jgi:hypothetical protein